MKLKWNRHLVCDLFVNTPTLVLLSAGGVLSLLSAVAFASTGPLFFGGLGLAGIGIANGIWRYLTDQETLLLKQVGRERREVRDREMDELQRVAGLVKYDTDKRTREYLKTIMTLWQALEDEFEGGSFVNERFRSGFHDLLWRSVSMIENSNKLLRRSQGLASNEVMLERRKDLLEKVGHNIDALNHSYVGLSAITTNQDEEGLDSLRRDLEGRLKVAQSLEGDLSLDPDIKEYL